MNKINFKIISIILVVFLLLFSACDTLWQFTASEYEILIEDSLEILNIENPMYVHSDNINIATVVIEDDRILITSVGFGGVTISIGDRIGLSNRARIFAFVDEKGKINIEEITKFDGRAVNPNIKNAITINGNVGTEITPVRIDLQMNGTHFVVTEEMDVISWFINIPSGLSAVVFDVFATNPGFPNEVYILISGTPLAVNSDIIKITVPGENAGRTWDVYFNTRDDARFNITE
ncbi:MAG: hypothetical protein FWD13_03455 [Treponema sp.]|nr:hypothetical protein [Treponema sp.]